MWHFLTHNAYQCILQKTLVCLQLLLIAHLPQHKMHCLLLDILIAFLSVVTITWTGLCLCTFLMLHSTAANSVTIASWTHDISDLELALELNSEVFTLSLHTSCLNLLVEHKLRNRDLLVDSYNILKTVCGWINVV